ncbi:hypothetical protein KW850_19625 [Bacillus sp. sid0103]|uniref:hypothetical protein n=1 Tax=Bacillus sp. sid0103 TaxID=2856337 RepID=UPI001C45ECB7|nr:hypothetical protein [Bacillus sp. sid0103]MBV7507454.1 hypothetical protein [Bacillus sp. sid0103]
MLKLIVDFGILLIGEEGAKTPAGGRGRGDPAGAQLRGGSPDRPRKAKRLERKSTGKFNRTKIKRSRMGLRNLLSFLIFSFLLYLTIF